MKCSSCDQPAIYLCDLKLGTGIPLWGVRACELCLLTYADEGQLIGVAKIDTETAQPISSSETPDR